MPVDDHQRKLQEIYSAALKQDASEQAEFVRQACAGDVVLRREIEALLGYEGKSNDFLSTSPLEAAPKYVADSQERSLVGRTLGPYSVLSLLGVGGMGEVYAARDTRLGRMVALKILPSDLAQDPESKRRFLQEARAASALNHPNIVTLHDVGNEGGIDFLVMEYLHGKTLDKLIPPEGLSIRESLRYAMEIAGALAKAHSAGIIHRDLKSGNVMVSDGVVKVLDFGLAKLTETAELGDSGVTATLTSQVMIVGTAAYMSPEQAQGRKVDARSDIFSFGVMLYEMLTGRRPFQGENRMLILAAILQQEPKPLTELDGKIPSELERVVLRCLRKDPERRYQGMADLRVALEELMEESGSGKTASAEEVKRLKTAEANDGSRVKPRQPGWMIKAFAVLIFLLAALGALWRLRQKDYFWTNPLTNARVERLTDFEGDEISAAISPDGKFTAFLSDREGQFDAWVSQIGSGEFINLTKGRFPFLFLGLIPQVGFSGDGAQIWIVSNPTPVRASISLAPSVGGEPHPFLDDGLSPAWSPDGSQIVYHKATPGDPIFLADRNGTNSKQIFIEKPGIHCHFLTWSADGHFVYFVRGAMTTDEMDIWRIPVSESAAPNAERLTSHNARVAFPAWLDSRTLIYSATADDGSGQWLYSMDVERRIPHRVSSGIAEQYFSVAVSKTRPPRLVTAVATPTASLWTVPLSDHIQSEEAVSRFPISNSRGLSPRFTAGYLLFLSSRGGGDGLWKLEKGATRELWNGSEGGVVAPPAISPDGSQICFAYRKQGRSGLYLMSGDGTNIRSLTESLDVRGAASWSPDGKWIAFAASQGEGSRVFKVAVAGGPPVRLVDQLSYRPLWSPDGRFIVYSAPSQGGSLQVKAITPDKAPAPLPEIRVNNLGSPYRFIPNSKEIVFLKEGSVRRQNFYWLDLQTGQQRQLTDLKPGFLIQSFDISPDRKQIVFDRLRENSDIVLIDLKR